KPCASTSDSILHASDVVVNDFEEFATLLPNLRDVGEYIISANTDLVRTQCRKPVVRVTLRITVHQAVHGQTTCIDDLYNSFEREYLRIGCQCVVLTHGVPSKEGVMRLHTGFSKLSNLCTAQSSHGYLSELSEEQRSIWVGKFLTINDHEVRVITHNLQNGKAQFRAGVRISAFPHVTCRGRGGVGIQPHALGLNTLTWESVESTRRCHGRCCL